MLLEQPGKRLIGTAQTLGCQQCLDKKCNLNFENYVSPVKKNGRKSEESISLDRD
jgi:hypothetical protein